MKSTRIAQAWLSYRAQVLPSHAGTVQVIECRRAFYAGAWAFCTEIRALNGPGSDVDKIVSLEGMLRELVEFRRNEEAGVA